MFDAVGKTCALLWQIYLMCGPQYGMLRAYCNFVRSITTDMGVERKMVDFVNMAPEFYSFIDRHVRRPDDVEDHFFP